MSKSFFPLSGHRPKTPEGPDADAAPAPPKEPGAKPDLISFDEANAEAERYEAERARGIFREYKTGVACPKCGGELFGSPSLREVSDHIHAIKVACGRCEFRGELKRKNVR